MENLNRVLLENVLPAHVAEHFLGRNWKNEVSVTEWFKITKDKMVLKKFKVPVTYISFNYKNSKKTSNFMKRQNMILYILSQNWHILF